MAPGRMQFKLMAVLHGLQLTLEYLLMLVALIYSGHLFVSVILGLVAGHILLKCSRCSVGQWASLKAQSGHSPISREKLRDLLLIDTL